MAHKALQNLVGRAIIDKDLRDQLLNGSRQMAVADFDLTDDERKAIYSIQARSLEEFAGKLHAWIETADGGSKAGQRRPSRL